MHHYRQPEPLAAERIRGRLAEAEEFRPAIALGPIPGQRTTRGKARASKKVRLPIPGLWATRSTCDTPGIGLQRRAS
jgi:hypothetical protein